MRKFFILFWLIPFWSFAQVNETAINPFIEYTNESIHGMLIIHRMLENFNQQLNKFVDLESNQVNFYGNDDLPKNIFEDAEHFFYDTSPYEWYQICTQKEKEHPELARITHPIILQMKRCSDELNQLRFDLERLIKSVDLNKSPNQKLVYKKLSKGELLYDQFFTLKIKMEKSLQKYLLPTSDPLINSLTSLHTTFTKTFSAFRDKDESHLPELEASLKQSLAKIPGGGGRELHEIRTLSREIIKDVEEYQNNPQISIAYKQYGYFYFYHNVKMINKFNRYGNGLVYFINAILKKRGNTLLMMEIPHYFKVIYPLKEEVTPFMASKDERIEETPEELEHRLIIAHEQKIKVDHTQVEFLIFDHKEQDGDVLSLNFNGDWVLENYALTTKPFPLKLSLNNSGKNFLILHAVNTGSRPPNTVAVSYFYKGKRQQIILNSDLNTSEMIEISIDDTDN